MVQGSLPHSWQLVSRTSHTVTMKPRGHRCDRQSHLNCAILLKTNNFVMGSLLALAAGMRTLALLATLLVATPQAATDQKPVVPEGTIITSVQVTGFDIDRLSPGLRQEIRSLTGTPLKQERLDELAARIEAERPRYVAAVRAVMDPGGQANVFFVMGRQAAPDRDDNVNARYIVEEADITGVPEDELTEALRDDLRALVGKRLDSGEADRLQERIEREFQHYDVSRRIQRGDEVGRIRLVYEARKKDRHRGCASSRSVRTRSITRSRVGGVLDLGIGGDSIRFTPIVAIDNADDLVEEYSGSVCVSKRGSWGPAGSVPASSGPGSIRIGVPRRWMRSCSSPRSQRRTDTINDHPIGEICLGPDLSVAAGVSISELEPLSPATDSEMANAAVASIDFDRSWWNGPEATHHVRGNFSVRAGSRELESDLVYTRYLGQGSYRFDLGRHHVRATGMAGGITGHAPLFERFTLGDSTTLRGWDKYESRRLGPTAWFHTSIEYRYTGLALFLDIGSVWDADTNRQVRVSTGFGFHAGPTFLVVGFPLNTDKLGAVVTLGLRIPGVVVRW